MESGREGWGVVGKGGGVMEEGWKGAGSGCTLRSERQLSREPCFFSPKGSPPA